MQPREYRTHVATTILVGAGGVISLALFAVLIIDGITSTGSRAAALIIGFTVLPLPLYLVAGALRPAALAADDAGLHLRRIFGSQHIPWEAVRAFRVERGGRAGPSLQATLRTDEVIWMPTPTSSGATARRIANELTEALREHSESAVLRPDDRRAGPDGEQQQVGTRRVTARLEHPPRTRLRK